MLCVTKLKCRSGPRSVFFPSVTYRQSAVFIGVYSRAGNLQMLIGKTSLELFSQKIYFTEDFNVDLLSLGSKKFTQ